MLHSSCVRLYPCHGIPEPLTAKAVTAGSFAARRTPRAAAPELVDPERARLRGSRLLRIRPDDSRYTPRPSDRNAFRVPRPGAAHRAMHARPVASRCARCLVAGPAWRKRGDRRQPAGDRRPASSCGRPRRVRCRQRREPEPPPARRLTPRRLGRAPQSKAGRRRASPARTRVPAATRRGRHGMHAIMIHPGAPALSTGACGDASPARRRIRV